jgi:signal transduction histidine kinase
MEQELRYSQKMEAIGQMAGGIVHDFKNLLMVVNGSIEQLGSEPLTEKSRRLLGFIKTAAQQGERLTRQILHFSRNRPEKPEVINLIQLLKDMSEMLRHSLRTNIQIKLDLPSTPCLVQAAPDALYLAILNLAVNARDAMVQGGTFTVAISPLEINRAEFIALSFADRDWHPA